MDWSKVFEVLLGAVLAFVFGITLQFWLVRRQERFHKELLDRQLKFLEKLEKDRADSEAKAQQRHLESLEQIAIANLDHTSMLKFIDHMRNP